jgi:hypothetical protein
MIHPAFGFRDRLTRAGPKWDDHPSSKCKGETEVGLGRWYWNYNSFYNKYDRQRARQRRTQAARARTAKQQTRDIQQRHAGVQAYLNQQGRTGFTAAELRATRIQMEAAGVPQAEVRARMRVLNQYKQPGR